MELRALDPLIEEVEQITSFQPRGVLLESQTLTDGGTETQNFEFAFVLSYPKRHGVFWNI